MSDHLTKSTQETAIVDSSFPVKRIPRALAVAIVLSAIGVFGLWTFGTPAGIIGKANAIGYAICHRIASHSFLINGDPMPLCARCTGIYLGVVTGLLIQFASRRRKVCRLPGRGVAFVLGLFIVLMAIDGANSYLTLLPGGTGVYEPHNALRLITGIYCGFAVISLIYPVFNGVVWADAVYERGIRDFRELAGMCAVVGFVALLVLSERPTFLLILGLISVLGVVAMLTMIGTVLFISITRRDGMIQAWRGLAIPVMAGFTLAFIEIGGIDTIRLFLTGTWAGFPIGR